ncbi:MAG: toxin-antitoxin system YwqK family antitoxin [Flavobacteriaceae bacterium]|nr:toxin-antitoxin system YwqK family antitoxin [Flavobacteriaceae bacterium]
MMKQVKKLMVFCCIFLMGFGIEAQSETNQLDANGKRHGVWKKYYNNGRVRYMGQFENGKEVGVFKYYSAATSDFPIVVKEFNKNDQKAIVKFYTKEGTLESKGSMIGKKRIGKWLYFHVDGKTVMSEENYNDGKLHGFYRTFYNSGKPTEIASYKDGKLDGNYKKYSIKGHLYQDFNYKNGKLNGPAVYYNRKTGQLTTKGQFINDVRVGTWENYVDGELVSTEQPNKKKPRLKKQVAQKEN